MVGLPRAGWKAAEPGVMEEAAEPGVGWMPAEPGVREEAADEAADLAGDASEPGDSSSNLPGGSAGDLAGDASEPAGDAPGDSSSAANCTLGAPIVLPRPG